VLGIDGDLHIVADNARALAAGRHRAGIGIGQRDLFVGRCLNLLANFPEGVIAVVVVSVSKASGGVVFATK
jgi:hypothetical protein